MNLSSFKIKQAPPGREYLRWQDWTSTMMKEYAIKPPQTFRIWALVKKNPGYVEGVWKALNESVEPQKRKESGGILISKLFPKPK